MSRLSMESIVLLKLIAARPTAALSPVTYRAPYKWSRTVRMANLVGLVRAGMVAKLVNGISSITEKGLAEAAKHDYPPDPEWFVKEQKDAREEAV